MSQECWDQHVRRECAGETEDNYGPSAQRKRQGGTATTQSGHRPYDEPLYLRATKGVPPACEEVDRVLPAQLQVNNASRTLRPPPTIPYVLPALPAHAYVPYTTTPPTLVPQAAQPQVTVPPLAAMHNSGADALYAANSFEVVARELEDHKNLTMPQVPSMVKEHVSKHIWKQIMPAVGDRFHEL